jgi:hypothetical protein
MFGWGYVRLTSHDCGPEVLFRCSWDEANMILDSSRRCDVM